MARTKFLLALLVPASALAEPGGEDDPPRATPEEPTAADVDGAPVPGEESGQVERDDGDSTARKVGRGLLFVPKVALQGAFAPVRGGVYAYSHYHLGPRLKGIFFNDEGTIGLYPTAQLESSYGLNVGARFVDRDLFGEHEDLSLHAGTGGRFRSIASAKLRSGSRLGRFALELEGQFEQRPKDAFYGFGNANTGAIATPDAVVEARYRERLLRTAVIGDLQVARSLHVRTSGVIADFDLGRSEQGAPIDELYPMEAMIGFGGIRHAYGELELRYDTRGPTGPWEDPPIRSSGWLLSGYAGRSTALGDGVDFWRTGFDLQRFVKLGSGPRVLAVRAYGEAVDRGIDEVPFTQLPRLGGKSLLRGYDLDRFRDRIAALGSCEYSWALGHYISASTFVDAGRVYPDLQSLSFDNLRVGYGVAIEGRTRHTYLLRASVASSVDGGLFFDVALDPVFDLDPRVERR